MKKLINLITAKTHTPEYLLHKYWSRKPHNIISHFLRELVPQNGMVIDPFCGSGVTLREASLLNLFTYGCDVNPIAYLISKVMINPPNIQDFVKIVSTIINEVENIIEPYYTYGDNKIPIKYAAHKIIVKCNKCNCELSVDEAKKKGRSYFCLNCDNLVRFNLENLINTKIVLVALEGVNKIINEPSYLIKQQELSHSQVVNVNINIYNKEFVENRRILAFTGMNTSKLFTPRNFSILCYVADKFKLIEDEKIKDAALLLLTASIAQCSRLIPFRNNLSTGGPAWSVPGFWVPPEHLETNPIVHLKARFLKFNKGLKDLNIRKSIRPATIELKNASVALKELYENKIKADLVFFDPPYGDSIPYLEFSSMWNSFLGDLPNPNEDISVSDRIPKSESWTKYKNCLKNILFDISKILKDNGKILITFNNNDLRAWEALIGALQENKFKCNFVAYQIPAVISSKAQFYPEGSYISDIYSVYTINSNMKPTSSLSPITEALLKCASSRDGIVMRNLAFRVATISWMQNNVSVELLCEKENLIKKLFKEENGKLIWKGNIDNNVPKIATEARKIANRILQKGPCEWSFLYQSISSKVIELGIPDPNELKSLLENHIVFDKKRCLANITYSQCLMF